MMKIGNVQNAGYQGRTNIPAGSAGVGAAADAFTKNIQKQIENAQKKIQDLSSNEEMTIEEKLKKKQEVQQEINNLNQQLRQHQIEQRKEQQNAGSAADDMSGGGRKVSSAKTGNTSAGLSNESMKAMISADTAMKQGQVQGGTITALEGKSGVLESEIKMDAGRGASTEKKEKELADTKQKALAATASQIAAFTAAAGTMKEAAKVDQQGGNSNNTDSAGTDAAEGTDAGIVNQDEISAAEATPQTAAYTSVDIYL